MRLHHIGLFLFLLIFSVSPALTQETSAPTECSALVEQALQELDTNCRDVGLNTACYGYNRLRATFNEPVGDDFFTIPGDLAELPLIQTIRTSSLDYGLGQWGLAMLRAQVNMPNALPGQAVVFVLMGNVEIENVVPPEEAFIPGDSILVTTATAAPVYTGPGTDYDRISTIPAGSSLPADALSPDGDWLRVGVEGRVAWAEVNAITPTEDLATLPTAAPDSFAPMQAFMLTTGLGDVSCQEAPNLLLIQSPELLTVELNINGVNIQQGSTVLFTARAPGADLAALAAEYNTEEIPEDALCTVTTIMVADGTAFLDEGAFELPRGAEISRLDCYTVDSTTQEHTPVIVSEWMNPLPLSLDDLTAANTAVRAPLPIEVEPPSIAEVIEQYIGNFAGELGNFETIEVLHLLADAAGINLVDLIEELTGDAGLTGAVEESIDVIHAVEAANIPGMPKAGEWSVNADGPEVATTCPTNLGLFMPAAPENERVIITVNPDIGSVSAIGRGVTMTFTGSNGSYTTSPFSYLPGRLGGLLRSNIGVTASITVQVAEDGTTASGVLTAQLGDCTVRYPYTATLVTPLTLPVTP